MTDPEWLTEDVIQEGGRALLRVGRIRFGGEEAEPVEWVDFEDFLLPRERRIIRGVLLATVPMILDRFGARA